MNYVQRYGIVYVATNLITGEQYVGQTKESLRRRCTNHKASIGKYKTKFALAMQKYGFSVFQFKEIFVAFDEKSLNDAEKVLIGEYCPAYNMTHGGAGIKGYKPTNESNKKRSKSIKLRLQDPLIKLKWSKGQIGRKHPVEEVFKVARSKWKPVYCKELSISFLNQKFAAEYFGVRPSAIVESMKRKGKINKSFTLERVS